MKSEYIIIAILAIIIGILVAKLVDKRNTNIIKLLIKRDQLPPAGAGTEWIEGAQCYMSDGTIGKTRGIYCEQIKVL